MSKLVLFATYKKEIFAWMNKPVKLLNRGYGHVEFSRGNAHFRNELSLILN